ncbi:MAG: alpha/beta hydrolase [Oscillospiraceae bacterium]|nr:alpha/beta hydrolase [Oscillospiraceae bacterium]
MKRAEYLEICAKLSQEELNEKAKAIRARAAGMIPPQVQALFSTLDAQTAVEELSYPTAWGKTHLYLVRRREDEGKTLPVLVNVHGGGWTLDHGERDLYFCRRLAMGTGCLVVDVDYVLAPEYPYPAALEEIEAVLNALPALCRSYGGDPERVILCGQSAGGNLLGGVAVRHKVTAPIRILGQILCYLPADNYNDHFDGQDLDPRGEQTELYGFFYNRSMEERKNPDVSLVMAESAALSTLPPTDILTCGKDNLLAEGRKYYECLTAAGVKTSYRCFTESRHGFLVNLYDEWREGEAYVTELVRSYLK